MSRQKRSVHFLTIGISQEHVIPVIERYAPDHIVFISSHELEEQTVTFGSKIEETYGINVEFEYLSPFREDAVSRMIEQLKQMYERISSQYEGSEVEYSMGVTGGTNLMVLAAGLVAIHYGMTLHYVLNPDFLATSKENSLPSIIEMDASKLHYLWNARN